MKLFNAYNHTFARGKTLDLQIYRTINDLEIKSITGLYIADTNYINQGIGSNPTGKVNTWVNLLNNGNYLYSQTDKEPDFIASDSQFNNQSTINFTDNTFKQLLFRYPETVKTIVVVYAQRDYTSYLLFSPKRTNAASESERLHYDSFPPGVNSLWAYERLDEGKVFNATSRINSRVVSSEQIIGLNLPRILSITNFQGDGSTEVLNGISGSVGEVGGAENFSLDNTFNGKLSALLTFSEVLTELELSEVELTLAEKYINYQGASLAQDIQLKCLVDTSLAIDFAPYVIDEWFSITTYFVVPRPDIPNYPPLNFVGSVLTGLIDLVYEDNITISISNSGGYTRQFDIFLEAVVRDPLVSFLPKASELSIVISTYFDNIHNAYSGLEVDSTNTIEAWEDARRLISSGIVTSPLPSLSVTASTKTKPQLLEHVSSFNSKDVANFIDSSELLHSANLSSRTFIWVYEQLENGSRPMLDTFPDIKGTGELWTVANTSQTHGTTAVTRLITTVQRIPVNTLNYRNKLNKTYIIVARVPTNAAAISYKGLRGTRGSISFFAAWTSILSDSEVSNLTTLLAERYYSDLSPYLFSNDTEFRTQPEVVIDLKTKVSDLRGQNLTYQLLNTFYNLEVSNQGILTFTAPRDEILPVSIQVTNTSNLSSTLNFDVDVILKTNTLYLALKNYLTTFELFLLVEEDSTTLSSNQITTWEDYRLNGTTFSGTNVAIANLQLFNNKLAAKFNIQGNSSFSTLTPISGRTFVIVYIKEESDSGRFFLLGQSANSDFFTGTNNFLVDGNLTSSQLLNNPKYVNGRLINNSYRVQDEVLNTVIYTTTEELTFDQIAQDRVFTDRSVKGYIPCLFVLETAVNAVTAKEIDILIRNYFLPADFVLLLHFDNSIIDSGIRQKPLIGTATIDPTTRKFGTGSLQICNAGNCNYLLVENQTDLAFLNQDFTISFWLQLSNFPATSLVLYSQSDLVIYIASNKLYVGRNNVPQLALLDYTLPNSFLSSRTFQHIALTKQDDVFRLYVQGTKRDEILDSFEYRDYNTAALIGQIGEVLPSLSCRLDEFVIYRRLALHTQDTFTVPTQPY